MNNKTENVSVIMSEEGDYVVIVGTTDCAKAQQALRAQEEEWYGKDHEEPSIPMDDFAVADICSGSHKGEETMYWGNNPASYFDGGKYDTEEGLIAVTG